MIGSFIVRSYNQDVDYYVQPEEIEKIESARFQQLAKTGRDINISRACGTCLLFQSTRPCGARLEADMRRRIAA